MKSYLFTNTCSSTLKATFLTALFILPVFGGWTSVHSQPIKQSVPDSAPDTSINIGVALSGGGARGLAHIGVLKVMEETGLDIDYITGASMGSIIGGLYAIGYSPDHLARLVHDINWQNLFSDRPMRHQLSMYEKMFNGRYMITLPIDNRGVHLPEGLITGQNILTLFNRLTWHYHTVQDFSDLPIPFLCTATDLETGEPVNIDSGNLSEAMRASMSIPSLFTPYKIQDKSLIDGSYGRGLPASEVGKMGADYIISVDVSAPLQSADSLNSLTAIMNQVMSFQTTKDIEHQRSISDLVVEPETRNFNVNDFNYAQELVRLGEKAARKHIDIFRKLARQQDQQNGKKTKSTTDHSKYEPRRISSIEINGLNNVPRGLLMSEFNIDPPTTLTPEKIEKAISNLYGTRFFDLITYQLEKTEQDSNYKLILTVTERNQNQFRVSFRYNSESEASLLTQLTFRNLLHKSSLITLQGRLGDITSVSGEYIIFRGIHPLSGLRSSLTYKQENIDWYDRSQKVASFATKDYRVDLTTGTYFSNNLLISGGLRREWISIEQLIGSGSLPFAETRQFNALNGTIWFDTMNRLSFPTRGHQIKGDITYTNDLFFSPLTFSQQFLYWKSVLNLHERVTLHPSLRLGRTTGKVPVPYWFYLQNMNTNLGYLKFMGFHNYESPGKNIQVGGLELQIEFADNKFIKLISHAGDTYRNWQWTPWDNQFNTGVGLSVGTLTFAGPAELTLSTSNRNPFMVSFEFGYEF